MGKRGPKPTPTAILKARGSWLADTRTDEPEPRKGMPTKPAFLRGEASEEWDRQAELLYEEGRLALMDRAHLAMYCAAWGEFVEAAIAVDEQGNTIGTDKGNVIQNPMVGIRNKSREAAVRIGSAFGFNPSARVGLKQPEKKAGDDEFERFAVG